MANEMLMLKADPSKVVTAGIFGWPRSDADMATAQYKVAPVPNPDTTDLAHPTVFDYWPVCYDPNHLPAAATTEPITGFDATAAAWGATGGLRESAFIDALGGMKFSICEPDFSPAMASIGQALAAKTQSLCFDQKLLDVDLVTPGLQPDCRVVWRTPTEDPKDPSQIIYVENPASMPRCAAGDTLGNVATDCWQLTTDTSHCPLTGQRIVVLRTAAEIAAQPQLPAGTKIAMQCRSCPTLSAGTAAAPGCDY